MQALEAIQAVEAVETHEARQYYLAVVKASTPLSLEKARSRIPEEYRGTAPYSAFTLWTYYSRTDHDAPGDSCPYCNMFDGQTFTGDQLRTVFPDHYWKGPDIYANVHKTLWNKEGTCTCLLIREPKDSPLVYDMWSRLGTDWTEKPKNDVEEK